MASKEFEALSISEWKLSGADVTGKVYRVFKNAHEFEMIEADNASEAISKCGTQDIYMIKFGSMDSMDILQQSMIVADLGAPEHVQAPQEAAAV
jgi:hypothetical protein